MRALVPCDGPRTAVMALNNVEITFKLSVCLVRTAPPCFSAGLVKKAAEEGYLTVVLTLDCHRLSS